MSGNTARKYICQLEEQIVCLSSGYFFFLWYVVLLRKGAGICS